MHRNRRSLWSSVARFARAHPVAAGLLALIAAFVAMMVVIAAGWTRLDQLHVPNVLAFALGWFAAVGTTLGIALLLMWINDQRDVNRSRRAIRLNFDHALLAMLELAHRLVIDAERHCVGALIEAAQKQIIAASARLKRYESKLTAFPPEALNAYADIENEIDVALEDLNDLHRKLRNDRDGHAATFGFALVDRVARFETFLAVIDARPTQASIAFDQFTTAQPETAANETRSTEPVAMRRA